MDQTSHINPSRHSCSSPSNHRFNPLFQQRAHRLRHRLSHRLHTSQPCSSVWKRLSMMKLEMMRISPRLKTWVKALSSQLPSTCWRSSSQRHQAQSSSASYRHSWNAFSRYLILLSNIRPHFDPYCRLRLHSYYSQMPKSSIRRHC